MCNTLSSNHEVQVGVCKDDHEEEDTPRWIHDAYADQDEEACSQSDALTYHRTVSLTGDDVA